MLKEMILSDLYYSEGLSIGQIARKLNVSANQIVYWMDKFGLVRRNRSQALYRRHNPRGDPFSIKIESVEYEQFLFGLGIGLFWGEGMKLNTHGVRLGNTDPFMILYFRDFLTQLCGVRVEKIKYSLQLFGDVDEEEAIQYWCGALNIDPLQLGKISMIQSRGKGTYHRKNKFGVLQIACHNTRLKLIIDSFLRTLKTRYPADVAQMVEHVHGELN